MKIRGVLAAAACAIIFCACGSNGSGKQSATPLSSEVTGVQTALAAATPNSTAGVIGAPTPVVRVVEVASGSRILTDNHGKTLYILTDDVPGTGITNCTDACAVTWPPLTVIFGSTPQTPGLGPIGQFRRPDGLRQVLYRGRPLYLYSGDKAPGDTNGDGIDGRWKAAVP
jgi:predicted lipoprotein with Yx(FWY)xxD motif